jgi:hypothetical protein
MAATAASSQLDIRLQVSQSFYYIESFIYHKISISIKKKRVKEFPHEQSILTMALHDYDYGVKARVKKP